MGTTTRLALPAVLTASLFGLFSSAPAHTAGSVEITSNQTNIQSISGARAPVQTQQVALDYVVLRTNFYSYNTCESYRKNYVVHYPYHLASYCTRTKQGNGRHWLYVAYESCPDVAGRAPEEV